MQSTQHVNVLKIFSMPIKLTIDSLTITIEFSSNIYNILSQLVEYMVLLGNCYNAIYISAQKYCVHIDHGHIAGGRLFTWVYPG